MSLEKRTEAADEVAGLDGPDTIFKNLSNLRGENVGNICARYSGEGSGLSVLVVSGSEPAGYADSSTRAGKLHKRHQYQCVPVTNNCNHCRHENKFADNLTTHKKFLVCGG